MKNDISSDYLPIDSSSIRTDKVVGYDIYLFVGTSGDRRFILYCRSDAVFENNMKNQLLEENISKLFIKKEDQQKYFAYLESNFQNIISDTRINSILKPKAETMKNTVEERTCILGDLLRDEALKKIIAEIKNLPSLPVLYNLIVAEMQSPEPSLKKVGNLISQDVSMSAKILQLVNSAFFGLPQKIANPQQAAVYVGIEILKSLVLSFDMFSSLEDEAESCGISLSKMWKHSLMTSILAKDIARAEKADGKVMEGAMIAGMLHDIGKLILLKVPWKYNEVLNLIEETGCSCAEAEYTVIKTSHSELGAYLLWLWGLPGNIAETVAFHHNPSKLIDNMFVMQNESSEEESCKTKHKDVDSSSQSVEKYSSEFSTLTAVHIANALTMQGNCSSETTSFPDVDMSYLKRLGLADRLPEWVELYKNTMQLSETKFR